MPSYEPVIKNGAAGAIFYASLLDIANPGAFKINPTIAPGDFQISKDGGAFANLATLPSVVPAGGSQVKFTLSQAETNGDNLTIQCVDPTNPKEWCDAFIRIQTAAQQFDTLASQASITAVYDRIGSTVGPTLSYDLQRVQQDTDDIQARIPVALISGRMDASVGAVPTTTNLGRTVAAIAIGTVTAGASVTSLPTSAFTPAGASADQFKGRTVLFDDSNTNTMALRACARNIVASSNAALPVLTVDALPVAPASGDTFTVI
jgi:hypothetical protein